MIWNESSKKSKKNDLWSRKNNQFNKIKEIKNIFLKFKDFLFCSCTKLINLKSSSNFSRKVKIQIVVLTLIGILAWTASGFYTIKESERGVLITFGKFNHIIYPGLNWKRTFIDTLKIVNIKTIREFVTSGEILTADKNIMKTEINVQYQIVNPKDYFFSVVNPDDSLKNIFDSALRSVLSYSKTNDMLTEKNTLIKNCILKKINKIIQLYKLGIYVLDVNFQKIFFPEIVKFISNSPFITLENVKQYILEAEIYAGEVKKSAYKQALYMLQKAMICKNQNISEKQNQLIQFFKLMPKNSAFEPIICQIFYAKSVKKY